MVPNLKFVGHSTDVIRQSKMRPPLMKLLRMKLPGMAIVDVDEIERTSSEVIQFFL